MSRREWIEPPVPARRLHHDPLLNALLDARLAPDDDAREFMDSSSRDLPNPVLLPGMEEAVERIRRALAMGETIAVFGDYDADGITSAAIVTLALRAASKGAAPAMVDLPTRAAGYGLSREALDRFAAGGATLLVTVDCGSTDHEQVAHARRLGMDVIAVDHHEIPDGPAEGAIVASARLEPDAPYREMSAAGLSLLLATALARSGLDAGDGSGADPLSLLDLAMIGTVGDVCDLSRTTNRAIVRDGLRRFRTAPRPGLLALVRALDLQPAAADARMIGMRIAPVLNAAGRKADPRPAFDLLLAENPFAANAIVSDLLASLTWVREQRARLVAEEVGLMASDPARQDARVLVIAPTQCPHGIAGALAGDLVKEVGRPVVVLSADGLHYRGSARTWGEFDIGGALRRVGHLLERTGGHRKAAGLLVHGDRVEDLRAALHDIALAEDLVPGDAQAVRIDADLPPDRLSLATHQLLERLRPWGEGNREPVLRIRDAELRDVRTMGADGSHLRLWLRTPEGGAAAVLWGQAARANELVGVTRVDIVGNLRENRWNGKVDPQIIAEDFRPGGS